MKKDVAKYIKNYEKCQKNKSKQIPIEHLIIIDTPQRAFDVVQIDTIAPLPTSNQGDQYIVTIICTLTKYLVSVK